MCWEQETTGKYILFIQRHGGMLQVQSGQASSFCGGAPRFFVYTEISDDQQFDFVAMSTGSHAKPQLTSVRMITETLPLRRHAVVHGHGHTAVGESRAAEHTDAFTGLCYSLLWGILLPAFVLRWFFRLIKIYKWFVSGTKNTTVHYLILNLATIVRLKYIGCRPRAAYRAPMKHIRPDCLICSGNKYQCYVFYSYMCFKKHLKQIISIGGIN